MNPSQPENLLYIYAYIAICTSGWMFILYSTFHNKVKSNLIYCTGQANKLANIGPIWDVM